MNWLLVFIEMKQKKYFFWFLQNLGKDFIRTNMHTTVDGKQQHLLIIDYVIVLLLPTCLLIEKEKLRKFSFIKTGWICTS